MKKKTPHLLVVPLYMKRSGHEPREIAEIWQYPVSIVLNIIKYHNNNDHFYCDIKILTYICSIKNNQLKTFE